MGSGLLLVMVAATAAAQNPQRSATDSGPRADSSKVAARVPAPRLASFLVAQSPVMLVTPGPSVSGWGARIRPRGVRTIVDGRTPLILLDGVRVEVGSGATLVSSSELGLFRLDDFAADNVETIEIVADGATAARYGPDAANGVVLLRTREGAVGPPRWEATVSAGARPSQLQWPSNFGGIDADHPDSATRDGGCTLKVMAAGGCAQEAVQSFNPLRNNNQFRRGWDRQLGLSVGGGSSRLRYFVAGHYGGDGGIFELSQPEVALIQSRAQAVRDATLHPDRDRRVSVLTTIRANPLRELDVRLTGVRFAGDLRLPSMTTLLASGFGGGSSARANDGWSISGGGRPAEIFQIENALQIGRWLGVAEATWRPASRFSLRGLIGHDQVEQDNRELVRPGEGRPGVFNRGSLFLDSRDLTSRTAAVTAAYATGVSTTLQSTTSIGVEDVRSHRTVRGAIGSPAPPDWNAIDTTATRATLLASEERHERAFIVEQRLAYRDAASLTGGIRYQIFPDRARGVAYPSIVARWAPRRSRHRVASLAGLRVGYGVAARRPLSNESERMAELSGGADVAFFAGRARLGFTVYDQRSDVTATALDPISAYNMSTARGTIGNRGVVVALSGTLWEASASGGSLELSVWGNRNRLLRLGTPPWSAGPTTPQIITPGFPVGGYWTRPVIAFSDADGDGILQATDVVLDSLFRWVGTPHPSQGATLAASVRWGIVRVGMRLDYQAGHVLFNQRHFSQCSRGQCQAAVDPRTPLADQAEAATSVPTLGFFEDADFLKLRELSATFDAPALFVQALRAHAATIILTGRNLITWTGYTGLDPEGIRPETIPGRAEVVTDGYMVPPLRAWSLTVRLTY